LLNDGDLVLEEISNSIRSCARYKH
jgi:hypothetical protein